MSEKKPDAPSSRLGFTEARRKAVAALLDEGEIRHEQREAFAQKNLLAIRAVSRSFVARLLVACTGTQYSARTHYADSSIELHIFQPVQMVDGHLRHWYIKLYFRGHTVFVSVHPSHFQNEE